MLVEHTTYGQFGKCIHISNDLVEVYITTEFGPRVIHFSLKGEPNFFYTNEAMNYIKKGTEFDEVFYKGAYWNVYGGNRLWRCPHNYPSVFYPDHDPVDVELLSNGAIFYCKEQIHNKLKNTVKIELEENSSKVQMSYSIKNVSDEVKKIGCWSLNVCDIGGTSFFPQPQTPLGFIPNRHITLWDYSDMRDERVYWGGKYIALKGDSKVDKPIKIGINNVDGWGCYLNKGMCYVVRYKHFENEEYTDFGVSYETYTNPYFLELETISPLKELKPGGSVQHSETWEMFRHKDIPKCDDEEEVNRFIEKFIVKK